MEKSNKEIKWRADLIGILPKDAAIVRLFAALMRRLSDEWALTRSSVSIKSLARATDAAPARLPAVAA